ncbi:putative small monomeric GTPase [Helianthus annuus]|uniref:Small monomeric GTPase n=1 Tax=Helianthus annuus TaxID=4232 RepID=A0A9K3NIQ9_HELAN|nr:putative small monomeric GTPase [Helianthus annuus]
MIRVKFLRLARRLGQTPHNVVVAQVLYRLGLAEQIEVATEVVLRLLASSVLVPWLSSWKPLVKNRLSFRAPSWFLGKPVFVLLTHRAFFLHGLIKGKTRKFSTLLNGLFKNHLRISCCILIVWICKLGIFGDMPLLRTITDIFGQSIWFNAIVVLTHAASAPPEGPNGTATSYDMFVTQRSHVVQQAIRQAAGDMRLMNPVSLVENHSACRTNRAGQRVLPNGQVWKPHLLLLSFASKILVEANMLLKLQDSPPGKPFAARTRAPPLPYILSNLLQSRPQLKLPHEQFGDDDDGDDMDESSDEESSEYDELPPFKRLTNSQLSKLSKAQKKSYYDELEYREKLFMKKQLHEEKKQRKMMKKMAEAAKDFPTDLTDNVEEDSNGSATVPVAAQDMNLPASFDADNPTHRYRALESANQWLIRPVLDPHGWDHDVGYEGINVEHLLAVKQKIPISFSGQITKDKKDANLQMEVSSAKHG